MRCEISWSLSLTNLNGSEHDAFYAGRLGSDRRIDVQVNGT